MHYPLGLPLRRRVAWASFTSVDITSTLLCPLIEWEEFQPCLLIFLRRRHIQHMFKSSGTKRWSEDMIDEFWVARTGFWTHISIWPVMHTGLTGLVRIDILQSWINFAAKKRLKINTFLGILILWAGVKKTWVQALNNCNRSGRFSILVSPTFTEIMKILKHATLMMKLADLLGTNS
jgi:hypothetical protein